MLLHNLNVILQNPYVQHDRADPAVSVSARLRQGLAVGSDACENGCRRQHSRVVRLIGGAQQACQISAKAAKLVQVVCAAGFVRPVLQSPVEPRVALPGEAVVQRGICRHPAVQVAGWSQRHAQRTRHPPEHARNASGTADSDRGSPIRPRDWHLSCSRRPPAHPSRARTRPGRLTLTPGRR